MTPPLAAAQLLATCGLKALRRPWLWNSLESSCFSLLDASDDEAPGAVFAEEAVKEELVEDSGEPPSSFMAPAVPVQDLAAPAAPLPRRLRLGEGVSMETELPDSKRVRVS